MVDYSEVDMMCLRYKFVNFGRGSHRFAIPREKRPEVNDLSVHLESFWKVTESVLLWLTILQLTFRYTSANSGAGKCPGSHK